MNDGTEYAIEKALHVALGQDVFYFGRPTDIIYECGHEEQIAAVEPMTTVVDNGNNVT